MYAACLFCTRPLGANAVLDAFPVGRRLAFDAARGRLWVVCPHCHRWNLTPLEERWEAIEEYVGASPAWVIRRYRLQAAAARLTARPPADVRAVAWELGYADQAHLIRDFRAAVGVTPGAYVQARA